MFEACVITVLQVHQKVDSSGMHSHVAFIRGGGAAANALNGGTLRQRLFVALEAIVVQAFSAVIRFLDRDFNLNLLAREGDVARLWYVLARCPAVADLDAVGLGCVLSATPLNAGEAAIHNSGRHGVLVSRYPFSARIIRVIETKDARDAIVSSAANPQLIHTRSVQSCAVLFGPEVSSLWSLAPLDGYLYDLVSGTAPRFSGLALEQQLHVYRLFVTLTRSDSIASPGAIHASVWINEARILRLCALLSAHAGRPQFVDAALGSIEGVARPTQASHDECNAIIARLALVDLHVAAAIVEEEEEEEEEEEQRAEERAGGWG